MRVTLSQVARRAGVSSASASRALNGESASALTIQRVKEAARELSYVPDARARSLKSGATSQLAFAVADVGNHVYVEMMRAVEDAVSDHGYRVLVSSTGSRVEGEIDLVRSLQSGFADGLIISPLRVNAELLAELERITVPVVVIGHIPAKAPFDNVQANSSQGVNLAVKHLLDGGRRRIGFLNGPTDTTPGRFRGRAFTGACRSAGLTVPDRHLGVAEDFTFEAGLVAARLLLRGTSPDAVIAANDLLAAGVLHAAAESGRAVPTDVAVVGIDNSALAGQILPTLTSVDLGSAVRGRLAAELLVARIEDATRPVKRVSVEPRLVVRRSSRADPVAKGSGGSGVSS